MPTRARDMRRYLVREFGPSVRSAAVAQKVTEVLLEQDYLLPAQRAALYRYLVTLPGLKVVRHVRDYRGRPGVGVSVSTAGFTAMWIFDQKTYAYLGSTDVAGGKVSFGSAILRTAIVDRAGQRSRS